MSILILVSVGITRMSVKITPFGVLLVKHQKALDYVILLRLNSRLSDVG